MDEPAGIFGNQRLGDVPQAQEVDRDDQRRVADPGGDAGDVEQRIDLPTDGRSPRIDRCRVGQVDLMKLVDLEGRPAFVQSDDIGPELGELAHHMFADARRTPGDHGTAAVVAPQLVDLSQRSHSLPVSLALLLCALRRLHAALVDLRHRLGDLAGGELTAAAGGQATERVVLVELRRGRLRAAAPRPSR